MLLASCWNLHSKQDKRPNILENVCSTKKVTLYSLIQVISKSNGDVLVIFSISGHQLGATKSGELRGSNSRRQRLQRQRDHGAARPQHVHTCCVTIAEWRVQADVCQLAASNVLFFGRHWGEDDALLRQPHGHRLRLQVGFAYGWKSQQPQHRIGHILEDADPTA